jgi:TusA-related sulfurtransferase
MLNSMQKGQVLKMLADDPGSEADMKSWSRTTGNELLKIEKEGDAFIFYIKKSSE